MKERLKIPLWCHARTADRLDVPADRLLEDGEVLELAGELRRSAGACCTRRAMRAATSAWWTSARRAAVVGDMVAGVGTIVIDPPEGDMRDYLTQLARLRDLPVTTLYPAHGAAIPDGPGKLQEYLDHRAARGAHPGGPARDGATLAQVVETPTRTPRPSSPGGRAQRPGRAGEAGGGGPRARLQGNGYFKA